MFLVQELAQTYASEFVTRNLYKKSRKFIAQVSRLCVVSIRLKQFTATVMQNSMTKREYSYAAG